MSLSMATTDPEQARRLFQEELSNPEYQRQFSGPLRELLENILAWLDSTMISIGDMSIPFGPLILLVLILGAVALTLMLVRPRLQRRGTAEPLLDIQESISAEQLTARAHEHFHAGRFSAATQDYFRAAVRAAEEHRVLGTQRSSTATEAAEALSRAFPEQGEQLQQAAREFNISLYGGAELTRAQAQSMGSLALVMQQTDPQQTAVVSESSRQAGVQ